MINYEEMMTTKKTIKALLERIHRHARLNNEAPWGTDSMRRMLHIIEIELEDFILSGHTRLEDFYNEELSAK